MKFHKKLIEQYLPKKTRRRHCFERTMGKFRKCKLFLLNKTNNRTCTTRDQEFAWSGREPDYLDCALPGADITGETYVVIDISQDPSGKETLKVKLNEIKNEISRR